MKRSVAPFTPQQWQALAEGLTCRSIALPSGCIEARGYGLKHTGYVQISVGSRRRVSRGLRFRPIRPFARRLAHVLAWELAHGRAVPSDQVVMHTCDNRRCVNPAHLMLGTQLDNIRDCSHKGRRNAFGHQKLQTEDVREIRERLRVGDRHIDIARAFGVARNTISQIGTGATWGWLDNPSASQSQGQR